ncbi:MAG: hypothetical protein QXT13_05425, partial [Pyrobaculum sp.]
RENPGAAALKNSAALGKHGGFKFIHEVCKVFSFCKKAGGKKEEGCGCGEDISLRAHGGR